MTEITKETITTDDTSSAVVNTSDNVVVTQANTQATSYQTVEYLIYFFFGALEVLLAFRLVLKLMGAGVSSFFVSFIYALTGLFVLPFEGIFRKAFTQGIETTSVLEPSTLVAIVVYAFTAWGIVKLLRIFSGKKQA